MRQYQPKQRPELRPVNSVASHNVPPQIQLTQLHRKILSRPAVTRVAWPTGRMHS